MSLMPVDTSNVFTSPWSSSLVLERSTLQVATAGTFSTRDAAEPTAVPRMPVPREPGTLKALELI